MILGSRPLALGWARCPRKCGTGPVRARLGAVAGSSARRSIRGRNARCVATLVCPRGGFLSSAPRAAPCWPSPRRLPVRPRAILAGADRLVDHLANSDTLAGALPDGNASVGVVPALPHQEMALPK